jgi:hypothetical protein
MTNHDETGSILLPKRQEKAIIDKIDDIRYDVRRAGNLAGAGLLCLSAAIAAVAVAKIATRRSP